MAPARSAGATASPRRSRGRLFALAAWRALKPTDGARATLALVLPCVAGAIAFAALPPSTGAAPAASGFWLALLGTLALALISVQRSAALAGSRLYGTLTSALFGLWVLFFWQVGVTAFEVPRVLLPAPSAIVQSMLAQWDTLGRRLRADRAEVGARRLGARLGARLRGRRRYRSPAVPAARPAAAGARSRARFRWSRWRRSW